MHEAKPDNVDHEALWDRIEHSEARMFGLVMWLAGGFVVLACAALAWGNGQRSDQLETNATVAEKVGVISAQQANVSAQLDKLADIVREESATTREALQHHAENPRAHGQR